MPALTVIVVTFVIVLFVAFMLVVGGAALWVALGESPKSRRAEARSAPESELRRAA